MRMACAFKGARWVRIRTSCSRKMVSRITASSTQRRLLPSVGPIRSVTAAEGQWHHDLGLTYNWETAALTVGVNNLTDEEPPLISQEAGPNRNNAVASARYDLIGTSYFVNFVKNF